MKRLFLLALFVVLACAPASAAPLADFADYTLRNPRQVILNGRLYTPPEAAFSPRPLMVFLHGSGAIGTNNITQVEHTPDPLLDEAKRRGAYLYLPQAPSGGWANLTSIDAAMTMIDRAVSELNADPRRLYVTGYSNGGGGTWNILSRNPDTFAAAIAVAGVAPVAGFNAANLLDTAIIAVHSADDPSVPVARSRTIVNGVLAAAGERLPTYPAPGSLQNMLVANPAVPFHQQVIASQPLGSTINHWISRPELDLLYFEQPFGGHGAPLGVFWSQPVYDWMFSHAIGVPEPTATPLLVSTGIAAVALQRRRRPSHLC